jgi:hypothetical protein
MLSNTLAACCSQYCFGSAQSDLDEADQWPIAAVAFSQSLAATRRRVVTDRHPANSLTKNIRIDANLNHAACLELLERFRGTLTGREAIVSSISSRVAPAIRRRTKKNPAKIREIHILRRKDQATVFDS